MPRKKDDIRKSVIQNLEQVGLYSQEADYYGTFEDEHQEFHLVVPEEAQNIENMPSFPYYSVIEQEDNSESRTFSPAELWAMNMETTPLYKGSEVTVGHLFLLLATLMVVCSLTKV
jgi:hypothetical protein